MRRHVPLLAAPLLLVACSRADRQADALDNAAQQADPAAAAVMRNAANEIREDGTNGSISAPGSAVQDAMQNAGDAAEKAGSADVSAAAEATAAPVAKPHRAGQPVPAPQVR